MSKDSNKDPLRARKPRTGLVDALAAYDETRRRGADPTSACDREALDAAGEGQRFDRAKQCIDLLAAACPRQSPAEHCTTDGCETCPDSANPAPVLDPPLGQFGPFELHEVLGIGGMGTVYKAWDSARRQIVAVKVVAPQYAADISVMARYRREMAAGGAIRHPHLRACLAAEVIDGKHCLVMEYIDGNDLSVIVARRGALAVPDACEVVRQAAEALHFAHCRGLVHRDVKPSNLILDHAGRVKVLDLGLALLRSSLAHRPHAHDADEAGSVTSPGQILGTADFMAPEQALEPHAVDARTDVYALGCTLYYLLAGRPPFSGAEFDTPGKKMVAHVTRPLPPLAESKREIPLPLWSVIDRATAKVPDHRLGNAAMLAVALKPLSAGSALSQLD